MNPKRLHITCDNETYSKIESIKSLLHIKRDQVVETAINSLFKEVISEIAVKEGLIDKKQIVDLTRAQFEEPNQSACFNDICDLLNLKGQDGRVSSIESIQLELNQAVVKDSK